jgi:hypothetical protein
LKTASGERTVNKTSSSVVLPLLRRLGIVFLVAGSSSLAEPSSFALFEVYCAVIRAVNVVNRFGPLDFFFDLGPDVDESVACVELSPFESA